MFPALRDVLECMDNVQVVASTDSSASAVTVPLAFRQAIRLILCSLEPNYAIAF